MTSMDESAMKVPEFKCRDATNQNHRKSVVSLEGYDTSLQRYYAKLILEKNFSSCGKITDISLSRDLETGLLESSASIFFDGEGDDDKALELSGTFLGGWKVVVARENYSDYISDGDGDYDNDDDDDDDDEDEEEKKEEDRRMMVLGFNTSATELDIMIKLCKHFSTCGEVTEVAVVGHGRTDDGICFALVDIRGQNAAEQAQKLKDCDLDGGNIRVDSVFPTNAEFEQRVRKNIHELNTTGHYICPSAYIFPTD